MSAFTSSAADGTLLLFPADAEVAGWSGTLANPFSTAFDNDLLSKLISDLPDVKPTRNRAPSGLPAIDSSDGAVKRPNGQLYVPRKVTAGTADFDDISMVRLAYAKRIPMLLYGEPGTGKTALAEAALDNLITVPGTGDTEVSDFLGGYVQNPDGTFNWVDGPLIRAMENGVPLLVDEVALIDSKTMAVVYSVMDGRDEITITANPSRGTVKAADGFYVLGACNPNVPGAVMSEALMSRFIMHVEVGTDYDLAQKLGASREIVIVAKNLKRKCDAGEVMKAPQMRELLGFKDVEATFGRDPALANFISLAEPGDRETYIEAIKSSFGKKFGALSIG